MSAGESKNTELDQLAEQIEKCFQSCVKSCRRGVFHARDCGRLLRRAKKLVGHTEWQLWIKANTTLSTRTCNQYMQVAREWRRIKQYLAAHSGESVSIAEAIVGAGISRPLPHRRAKKLALAANTTDELPDASDDDPTISKAAASPHEKEVDEQNDPAEESESFDQPTDFLTLLRDTVQTLLNLENELARPTKGEAKTIVALITAANKALQRMGKRCQQ